MKYIMRKTWNKFFLLIIPILLALSCKKEEERRLGDGTISFYMNGELWQNSAVGNTIGGINSKSYRFRGGLEEVNRSFKGIVWDESLIYVGVSNGSNNYYELGNGKNVDIHLLDDFKNNKMTFKYNSKVYLSRKNEGYIKYTKLYADSINKVSHIEGVFEATLYNKDDSSDIIEITDGRFNN
jgi:hypothetical protein